MLVGGRGGGREGCRLGRVWPEAWGARIGNPRQSSSTLEARALESVSVCGQAQGDLRPEVFVLSTQEANKASTKTAGDGYNSGPPRYPKVLPPPHPASPSFLTRSVSPAPLQI